MSASGLVPGEARFALLPTTRHLLPLSVFFGLLVALLAGAPAVRIGFLLCSLFLAAVTMALRHRRPELVLTPSGYHVEAGGKIRFQVAYAEVLRVLCDRSEGALYVDCGDRARNLLLPPGRGYPFTFADRDRLFSALLSALPDRIVEVPSLEQAIPPQPGPTPPR